MGIIDVLYEYVLFPILRVHTEKISMHKKFVTHTV